MFNGVDRVPAHNASIVTLAALPHTSIKLHDIQDIVAAACKISQWDMVSARRARPLVRARFMYYSVAREFTPKSYPQIGAYCGKRDHSTVMHGIRKVKANPAAFEPELSAIRKIVEAMI